MKETHHMLVKSCVEHRNVIIHNDYNSHFAVHLIPLQCAMHNWATTYRGNFIYIVRRWGVHDHQWNDTRQQLQMPVVAFVLVPTPPRFMHRFALDFCKTTGGLTFAADVMHSIDSYYRCQKFTTSTSSLASIVASLLYIHPHYSQWTEMFTKPRPKKSYITWDRKSD